MTCFLTLNGVSSEIAVQTLGELRVSYPRLTLWLPPTVAGQRRMFPHTASLSPFSISPFCSISSVFIFSSFLVLSLLKLISNATNSRLICACSWCGIQRRDFFPPHHSAASASMNTLNGFIQYTNLFSRIFRTIFSNREQY